MPSVHGMVMGVHRHGNHLPMDSTSIGDVLFLGRSRLSQHMLLCRRIHRSPVLVFRAESRAMCNRIRQCLQVYSVRSSNLGVSYGNHRCDASFS